MLVLIITAFLGLQNNKNSHLNNKVLAFLVVYTQKIPIEDNFVVQIILKNKEILMLRIDRYQTATLIYI